MQARSVDASLTTLASGWERYIPVLLKKPENTGWDLSPPDGATRYHSAALGAAGSLLLDRVFRRGSCSSVKCLSSSFRRLRFAIPPSVDRIVLFGFPPAVTAAYTPPATRR